MHDPFDPRFVFDGPQQSPCIYLTRDLSQFTEVDAVDYGFLLQWSWSLHYDQRGKAYARRLEGRRPIYMHRVVMSRVGAPPTPEHVFTDHINGDGLDNRRDNLRWATREENARNLSPVRGPHAHAWRRAREDALWERALRRHPKVGILLPRKGDYRWLTR